MRDQEVIILIECKKSNVNLANAEFSQLFRYFAVTKARIAILTNGIQYRFFTDLEEPNKMDERPFMELDIRDLKEAQIIELARLSRESFDLERMLSAANDMKYISGVKELLAEQVVSPDLDFVRFFFTALNPNKRFIDSAQKEFTPIVQRAIQQFMSEQVGRRLRNALEQEDIAAGRVVDPNAAPEEPDDGIETTEEEIEGYHVIKAICREIVEGHRITYRDSKNYFAVFIDDNNRKPICRLHFNRTQKYLGVFDVQKTETRVPIESIDDIYQHAAAIQEMARLWAV